MEIPTAKQIIAARGLLGLSQIELAEGSGVSISALKRFEAKAHQFVEISPTRAATISKLTLHLNSLGIAFLSHNEFNGVVLKEVVK